MVDFLRCELFGVDDGVDTEGLEEAQVVGLCVFEFVDARHRLLRPEFFGEHAAGHVATFIGGDADEKPRTPHSRLLKGADGGGRPEDGENVEVGGHGVEPGLLFVDEGDVVVFAHEHLGQVSAYFAGTGNDNFHRRDFLTSDV